MRTKHTPGPWFIDRKFPLSIMAPDREGEPPWHVAAIMDPCGDGGTPEAEANARLIAAAPDLLAALKDILEAGSMQHVRPDLDSDDIWERARGAIVKAEGGTG